MGGVDGDGEEVVGGVLCEIEARPMDRCSSRRAAEQFCCHNTLPTTAYWLYLY